MAAKAKADKMVAIMKFGKRQIILAALMLALGAAVYLNWQFTAPTPVEDVSAETETSSGSDERLGVAQLVNNSYIETVNDTMDDANVTTVGAKLSEARVERQNTRDDALGMLDDVLADVDADSDAKKQAIEEASVIAQNMVKETNIESLIKAKGINDTVVFINGDNCSVIVDKLGDNSLIIQDIVMSQTEIALDKISIIEAK